MVWRPRVALEGIVIDTSRKTLAPAATVNGTTNESVTFWLARSVVMDRPMMVAGKLLWFVKPLISCTVSPGEGKPPNSRSYASGAGCISQQLVVLPTVMLA